MKLNIVPARTGLLWVKAGIRTFLQQPMALTALFFLLMAFMSMATIVPLIGAAIALALLPLSAQAALKVGDNAPAFTTQAAVAGKAFAKGQKHASRLEKSLTAPISVTDTYSVDTVKPKQTHHVMAWLLPSILDGKQRLNAVLDYVRGKFDIDGYYFNHAFQGL